MSRARLVPEAKLAEMLASSDPIVRKIAEQYRDRFEKRRAYFQREDVKAKQRAYSAERYQRQKIESYAREVASERGITFDEAMAAIGAKP